MYLHKYIQRTGNKHGNGQYFVLKKKVKVPTREMAVEGRLSSEWRNRIINVSSKGEDVRKRGMKVSAVKMPDVLLKVVEFILR